jgi:hypothetical protein
MAGARSGENYKYLQSATRKPALLVIPSIVMLRLSGKNDDIIAFEAF